MCVWVEDADSLDLDSEELKIVYCNRVINQFLKKNFLGLAGTKGQGKTFLIKVKRKNAEKGVICLPENRMLDTIDSSLEIDKSLFRYLSDYNVWVNIWKFAISLAVLKKTRYNFTNSIPCISKIFRLNNREFSICFYVRHLLQLNVSDLKKILGETSKLLNLLNEYHNGINIYIDKLDQGFSNYIKNFDDHFSLPQRARISTFWQYAQYSLAEASYDIYTNINTHIKVFYTIRQEALIDSYLLNGDKARNIEAYISQLVYSKQDLREMYALYIKNEKDTNLVDGLVKCDKPSTAFVGFEDIKHGYVEGKTENVFDYIYRHTFKRPYDIMKICRKIYLNDRDTSIISIDELRHIVNSASKELLNTYLKELSSFLPESTLNFDKFLLLIPGNILTKPIMEDICSTYHHENAEIATHLCLKDCSSCEKIDYFTTLFNIGLIGKLQKHEADTFEKIIFENISSRILDLKVAKLPISVFYALHPALSNKIRDLRNDNGLSFNVNKSLVIGDGYFIDSDNNKNSINTHIKKITDALKKEKIFISSTVYDLQDERNTVRSVLKESKLHPIMSEYPDFDLENSQYVHSHDYCLDELKKCKSFIFIIGSEYGGIYTGHTYIKDCIKIKELSNNKIDNVSISLMEFYIARKNKMKYYVFVSNRIMEQHKNGNLTKDLKNEINLIQHFKINDNTKGNWMIVYNDIKDLRQRLMSIKF